MKTKYLSTALVLHFLCQILISTYRVSLLICLNFMPIFLNKYKKLCYYFLFLVVFYVTQSQANFFYKQKSTWSNVWYPLYLPLGKAPKFWRQIDWLLSNYPKKQRSTYRLEAFTDLLIQLLLLLQAHNIYFGIKFGLALSYNIFNRFEICKREEKFLNWKCRY